MKAATNAMVRALMSNYRPERSPVADSVSQVHAGNLEVAKGQ